MRWNPFAKRDVPVAVAEIGWERAESGFNPDDPTTLKIGQVVRGCLLALVALLPVFVLPFTAPGDVLTSNKQILLYVLLMAGLVAWLAVIIRQGGLILRRSGLEWGILAVLGAGILAAGFSARNYLSITNPNGLMGLASMLLFFFLVLNFFERGKLSRLVDWFILGAGVACLVALLVLFGVPMFKPIAWLSGTTVTLLNTVGSANALGGIACLVLILVMTKRIDEVGVVATEYPTTWKVIRIVAGVLAALYLLILNWSIFYVVLAVGMAGIIIGPGIIQKLTGQKSKFGAIHMVGPLVVFVVTLLLIFGSSYLNFGSLRSGLPVEVPLSQSGSWGIAQGAIKERPIFGFGQDNFVLAFDKYRSTALNNTQLWSSRFFDSTSELFNILIEQGVLGVLVWLFFLGALFYRAFGSKRPDYHGLGALWSVMPAILGAMVLFALYPANPVLTLGFWVLLAVAGAGLNRADEDIKVKMDDASLPSILSSLAFVVVLVFGLVGGYLLFQKYSGEVYFAQAARLDLSKEENLQAATDLLTRAINTNSHDDRYLNNLGSLLLSQVNTEIKKTSGDQKVIQQRFTNFTDGAIQVAQRMTVDPDNAVGWLNAGTMFENLIGLRAGADVAALDSYRNYTQRAPQDPTGFLRMGSVYLARADLNTNAIRTAQTNKQPLKNEKDLTVLINSDYKNAESNFKQAVALKPDLATALYNLGVVYERENRLDEATKQLELTRSANPNDAGLYFELALLYYRNNKKDQAITELTQAIATFKDYSNARWYLALMLEEKGDIEGAKAQLQEILKLDVNKDNQTIIDKLAALEAGQREIPPGKVTGEQPIGETTGSAATTRK